MKNQQETTGIIYVRVSSEEQVSGTSLDHQEKRCREYCEAMNIRILQVFREEGASAKSAERKQFLRAIEYCRQRKSRKPVDAFVVHKCDRFARNVEDHYMIRKKLADYGTKLHSVTEPIDESPQGKVFEAMLSAFAEFDNSIRRQRSIDGMSSRINDGIYPWKAPPGYACAYNSRQGKKKEKPDEPDSVLFPIIQKALKKFAQGHYISLAAMGKDMDYMGYAEARGRTTTRPQRIFDIMDKYLDFYHGWLNNPFTGQKVRGAHQPMITDDEYDRIKYHRNMMRNQPSKRLHYREEFPLRGVACCSECKSPFTGSESQGRSKKYAYYHCGTRNCTEHGKTIPVKKMDGSFDELISGIIPSPEFVIRLKKTVMDRWESEADEFEKAREKKLRKIDSLNAQKKRLNKAYLKGLFSEEEFAEEKEKIGNRIMKVKIEKSEYNIDKLDLEVAIDMVDGFLQSLGYIWKNVAHPEQRSILAQYVFSEPVLYNRKTALWNHALTDFFKYSNAYSENSGKYPKDSVLVPLNGTQLNHLITYILDFAERIKQYQKSQAT